MFEVAVTGIGAVSPVGLNAAESLKNVWAAASGIGKLPPDVVGDLPVRIGGLVKGKDGVYSQESLVSSGLMKRGDLNRLDSHALFAISAGVEALRQALGQEVTLEQKVTLPFNSEKFGISVGTSAGPVGLFQRATRALDAEGSRRVPPGAVIYGGSDSAASYLSVLVGARGTTAGLGATCASGALALGEAMRAIRHGYLDAVLVVGAEDCLNQVNLAGNVAIRSLTTNFADEPHRASRPFDRDRAGFVMSQGAAAILLEREDIAKSRGAKIYGRMLGFGSTSDAHHATAPHPEGEGAALAMKAAIHDANLTAADISNINAHGTSTPAGDLVEAKAIRNVFAENQIPPVTATKSITGHMLGAGGVFEALVALETLRTNSIPATLNLENSDFKAGSELALDIVQNLREAPQEYVLSNSFGFGGHNVALIMSR